MFRISGGNDKQGFPMKQGVLSANRVRLLLHKDVSCYRQRRRGERKRKSVRGCIVAADLAVLNLVVTKKGEHEIPGLTDAPVPRRLGPKRANKVRKLFNLGKVSRMLVNFWGKWTPNFPYYSKFPVLATVFHPVPQSPLAHLICTVS